MPAAKPNLKDIARELEVSVTTISRVLNGQAERYRISHNTAEKIRQYVKHHNFSFNEVARQLRLKKTHTIGLIVPDISNPFFAAMARSIEIEARKQHYFVMLCDSKDDTTTEAELIQLLKNRKVDGLILAPVGLVSADFEKIKDPAFPLVMIDRFFQDSDIPYVAADNFRGAYEAITLLTKNGHCEIGCLQGKPGTTTNENRVSGYRQGLLDAGLQAPVSYIAGDNYNEESGYQSTCFLLDNYPQMTALFCLSNLISLGALRAIAERKKKVPEDISIISFDEQPYSRFLSTPMTTIAQPQQEMGQQAVALLFSLMDTSNALPQKQILLPTRLIERASVRNLLHYCNK